MSNLLSHTDVSGYVWTLLNTVSLFSYFPFTSNLIFLPGVSNTFIDLSFFMSSITVLSHLFQESSSKSTRVAKSMCTECVTVGEWQKFQKRRKKIMEERYSNLLQLSSSMNRSAHSKGAMVWIAAIQCQLMPSISPRWRHVAAGRKGANPHQN